MKRELSSLLSALKSSVRFSDKGYELELDSTGCIVVSRRSHVIGFWHHRDDAYTWTPSGYADYTHAVASVEEAENLLSAVLDDWSGPLKPR